MGLGLLMSKQLEHCRHAEEQSGDSYIFSTDFGISSAHNCSGSWKVWKNRYGLHELQHLGLKQGSDETACVFAGFSFVSL